MTERRGFFDVALFIDAKADLKTVHSIMNDLDDAEIYPDYSTLDFQSEGLYFDAKTDKENVIADIERIRENWGWISIDYDTMAEWDTDE